MTGDEFKAHRETCGLSQLDWARALGYSGTPDTARRQMRYYETGDRAIPIGVALTAAIYGRMGRVPKWAWRWLKQAGVPDPEQP